jgi:hypothetical protein
VTATSELLLFQVGARVFGAAVRGAVRIGNVRDVPAEELVVRTTLGPPFERERGIVVAPPGGGERTLVVDRVLGFRSVDEDELHPLPAFAQACLSSTAVTGFVLMDDAPLLLVDLPTLVCERP